MTKSTHRFVVAVLAGVLWAGPVWAQTLKIATIAPEGASWMNDMRAGAKAIEEHTNGRVKFKFYGGGVQGNDKQVQRKMRTGQLHGGAFTSGGLNMFQDEADLFALPMMFNSIDEARYVRGHLEAELRQRLEEAGYVNFGFAAAGFAYMMSNVPLSTLTDLDGQKVWIPEGDPVGFAALRALGVAPVVMPVTDVMTGLQTDLLDSVTVPPVGAVVFQWHTRLKYITDVPVAYVYAALLIDRKAFARISPEDQQVVREVMEGIYRKFDQNGVRDNDQALRALLESGLQMVEPDAAEMSQWREIVRRSHRQLAREGVFDATLLERMERLLEDYRAGRVVTSP
ncbi:MAG: TRAP transporter substrate-binding protein DctP [Xanthomonadales bacterium]|jgi:TRAP-type C4-dicarboxylate transport system substrate-binding protein|nr:TRAP transporter substrate-binding protein DctP [Xanthomonadales bacterium]